jgi:hemerythrin-like domain-containing protein
MAIGDFLSSRRSFLKYAGMAVTMASGLPSFAADSPGAESTETKAQEISPVEDLMREHSVLTRCLLIYDEISSRIDNGKAFPPDALASTALLIQKFVEGYHEKLEENYIFPRFEKAGKFVDLVKVLLAQHQAGRSLTGKIINLSSDDPDYENKNSLQACLRGFCRMYRPHKAREDTVLFPVLHMIVTEKEYDSLGESFEDKEKEIFGEGGFEGIVGRVAGVEKSLGIFDISQFTPKV